MEIKAISIDFWGTLFSHIGSPLFRKNIRMQLYSDHLQSLGYKNYKIISGNFFETIDDYVKDCWKKGVCPTRDSIIEHIFLKYKYEVPKNIIEDLLELTYKIYTNELLPEPLIGAQEFVQYLSKRWPVYIISDTFTIFGSVLDQVLSRYGLLTYFSGQFYSDQVGKSKPDPISIQSILEIEKININNIIHIGDLIETDGELAKRAGCKCIIVNSLIVANEQSLREEPHIIGFYKNLDSVKNFLEEN